ncbi:MAG: hypothetical protein AAF242_02760 [Bacteroidota bacterium]
MDPVSAIITAVLSTTSSVLDTISTNRAAKYGRLPDWLSPRDFQKRDYTIELLIGGILFILVVIFIVIGWKVKRK